MSGKNKNNASRRQFLKKSGQVAAATTLVGAASSHVHAAGTNTLQVALVGCGGRGTGAAKNALAVPNGQTKLVAMADVFDSKLNGSYRNIEKTHQESVDVPEERRFIGFDGYKKAMDSLNPGDIVILATPPAFRWVQFTYAIEKGLNVFMEKPVTVDGPSTRKMLELGQLAADKNLKVGVGLMCRHCESRQELHDRIQQGEIGDLTTLRAYRMAGPTGSADVPPKPSGMSELHYQIQKFHGFLWASGGAYSDFLIHNIDECCWMKEAWPVEAKGSGGRHYRGESVDQNFDTYSVEYTFDDGTKLFLNGRTIPGCHNEFASYAQGTKGSAVISHSSHWPARSRIYDGFNSTPENLRWEFGPEKNNPYQQEWNDLVEAVRENKPYNEVERGAYASLVTSMGRMAAHTGQIVTLDQMLACEHEFAPDLDKMTMDSAAPVQSDSDGLYPVPLPGLVTDREY